ncbi:helix-turn-helix domain-containing protein [Dysgonomonas sp. 25]|uniref:winged helix-turn-helix transcriptional regulator n=1 Tax=Dysgonomonas sp. 25 TaxID=2302933 RepID=UPI0013D52B53|nr:helix-turn-helix domain-containing protein [Dysgonomonas sp. 25]NDV69346.1 transcriptional regulator [Dysgonomonas sp. 25]
MSEVDRQREILLVLDTMAVLSGKWKIPIITTLWLGSKRFKEIIRAIPGLTDKSLSKELKEMAEDQLIERIVYDTYPPKVEYTLTEHAESLIEIIATLRDWGVLHREKVLGTKISTHCK